MTLFEKLRHMQLTYCVGKYPIFGKNKALAEHLNCSPNCYFVMILAHEAKFLRKSDIAMFKTSQDYKGVLERELNEEEERQFRGERYLYVKVSENEDGVFWEYQKHKSFKEEFEKRPLIISSKMNQEDESD